MTSAAIALLAFLLPGPGLAGTPFQVYAGVFKADGTSGTAVDHNSYGRAVVYKAALAGQQALYPNPVTETSIADASGATPANFVMDAGSQFSSGINAGVTLAALVETRPGLFGWSGGSFVYFDRHVVSGADEVATFLTFANGRQLALPSLSATAATLNSITLEWSGLSDPLGLVSSYTLYRATYAPSAPQYRFGGAEKLSATAAQAATVSYVDSGLQAGTLYTYTLAPNFFFFGGAIGIGAEPAADCYTLFGQSAALGASTLPNSPTITPTHSDSPTPSPSNTPSPSLTASGTPPPSSTPSATPAPASEPGPGLAPGLPPAVFGPVPARRGERPRVYFRNTPSSSTLRLFALSGEAVAAFSFGAEASPALDCRSLAPGIYLLSGTALYPDGSSGAISQKIVLLP